MARGRHLRSSHESRRQDTYIRRLPVYPRHPGQSGWRSQASAARGPRAAHARASSTAQRCSGANAQALRACKQLSSVDLARVGAVRTRRWAAVRAARRASSSATPASVCGRSRGYAPPSLRRNVSRVLRSARCHRTGPRLRRPGCTTIGAAAPGTGRGRPPRRAPGGVRCRVPAAVARLPRDAIAAMGALRRSPLRIPAHFADRRRALPEALTSTGRTERGPARLRYAGRTACRFARYRRAAVVGNSVGVVSRASRGVSPAQRVTATKPGMIGAVKTLEMARANRLSLRHGA
jgi:hypothetical protein